MTSPALEPDRSAAAKALARIGDRFMFQTFDDSGAKRPGLIKQLYGTLDQCFDQLTALNRAGAGIYHTVNQTDGRGRTAANITTVRALHVDLDENGTARRDYLMKTCGQAFQPHLIVVSSPNKYHAYWCVEGVALEDFGWMQKTLIQIFGSDPPIHDLPRILRTPGFYHLKNPDAPFRSMVFSCLKHAPFDLIRVKSILSALPQGQYPGADGAVIRPVEQKARSLGAGNLSPCVSKFGSPPDDPEFTAAVGKQAGRGIDWDWYRDPYCYGGIYEAEAALRSIPNDIRTTYADWLRVGMSLRECGDRGREMWRRWTSTYTRCAPSRRLATLDHTWGSICAPGYRGGDQITNATLFEIAHQSLIDSGM